MSFSFLSFSSGPVFQNLKRLSAFRRWVTDFFVIPCFVASMFHNFISYLQIRHDSGKWSICSLNYPKQVNASYKRPFFSSLLLFANSFWILSIINGVILPDIFEKFASDFLYPNFSRFYVDYVEERMCLSPYRLFSIEAVAVYGRASIFGYEYEWTISLLNSQSILN